MTIPGEKTITQTNSQIQNVVNLVNTPKVLGGRYDELNIPEVNTGTAEEWGIWIEWMKAGGPFNPNATIKATQQLGDEASKNAIEFISGKWKTALVILLGVALIILAILHTDTGKQITKIALTGEE